MFITNDSISPVVAGYSTLIESIEQEKTIRIKSVSTIIQRVLEDARNSISSQWDEEGNESYEASAQHKLCVIAKYFSNDTLSYQGKSEDFHNLAVDYAKQGLFLEACTIIERGITLRPSSVDLLSDFLLYGKNVPAKRAQCQLYYDTLTSIPRSRWNWRAYSFSIEHLLEERNYTTSIDQEKQIKEAAIEIAEEFIEKYSKKHAEHDCVDRAYADLASIYAAYGEPENEYRTLKKCADTYQRVPITSMKLSEIEYSAGNYSEATQYLSNCAVVLKLQPSVNQGYVFLLRAHSRASDFFANEIKTEKNNDCDADKKSILSAIYKDLDTADLLIGDSTYKESITTLRKILEKQCEEFDGVIEEDWT